MESFMRDLARGAFTYAPPALDELSRVMDIDRRYSDLGLGLVDGSVIALAEGLGIRRLATPTCATSRRSACATGSRSSWSSTRRIPTDRDRRRNSASLQQTNDSKSIRYEPIDDRRGPGE